MKRIVAVILPMLAVSVGLAGAPEFSASDVAGAGIHKPGRILITNDSNSISAIQLFGDLRQALLTLRSMNTLQYHPYGAVVFDSSARIPDPLPAEVASTIREAASTHGVDPRLVAAVMNHESGLDAAAVSRAGARGLMQLMPETAQDLGVRNIHDVRENIFGGTRYLRMLLDTFHGDLDLTLAAYNAGPRAVERYRGVPPYRETMQYVAAVRRTYERSLSQ